MPSPAFDHDRMGVYGAARQLNVACAAILASLPSGRSDLADQLRRAAASVSLNIAEGAGEFAAREKARFYRMARQSATETAGILDNLVDVGLVAEEEVAKARDLAARVVANLVLLAKAMERMERDSTRERPRAGDAEAQRQGQEARRPRGRESGG